MFDEPGAELRILKKAEAVLSRRTGALLVVLERLQDGHNYCAVLRTMEALGVQHVWVVNPPPLESAIRMKRRQAHELAEKATNPRARRRAAERVGMVWEADEQEDEKHAVFAKRAQKWLTIRDFKCTADCVAALREAGRTVWVTALEQTADVLAPGAPWLQGSLPRQLAIVLGAEEAGVSPEFKAAADRLVYLPLGGFAESLNVSVAAALMTQLLLQLLAAAWPAAELRLGTEELQELRAKWYAQLAREKRGEEELERHMGFLDHPPLPLDDLRRPEAHRIHYVGKSQA